MGHFSSVVKVGFGKVVRDFAMSEWAVWKYAVLHVLVCELLIDCYINVGRQKVLFTCIRKAINRYYKKKKQKCTPIRPEPSYCEISFEVEQKRIFLYNLEMLHLPAGAMMVFSIY
ncbi:hypothetical protein TNIN_15061 [Trichonephila inaurata madagascariensis]|uniref:Uncharacterized protein n=1 Tax=Trichonephila inaurata madagascariensis TaxID=2747483 RepID=A0A8X7BYX9_9ARAC|nr:hypothetical protein TNIN_15061 [Trichonephila inaurata madagascariensis]